MSRVLSLQAELKAKQAQVDEHRRAVEQQQQQIHALTVTLKEERAKQERIQALHDYELDVSVGRRTRCLRVRWCWCNPERIGVAVCTCSEQIRWS